MATQYVDLEINTDAGYNDISFDSDGDFLKTDSLDTALFTSLLANSRASSAEVGPEYLRGGWWGNLFLDTTVGSKLWLLDQAVNTNETLSSAISYTQLALQWMITNAYADKINVSGSKDNSGAITLLISIIKNGSKITEKVYNLWQNTVKEYSSV